MSNPSLILPQSPAYGEDYVYAAQVNDGVVPLYNVLPLTFTRASNGTRINKDGILENMPYNLASYSNTFNNGVWVTGGYGNLPALTANAIANPVNGTTDAWSATFTSSGTQGRLLQLFTGLTIGLPYTYSMYVKAGSKTTVSVYSDTASIGLNANFNLSNGTITSTSGVTATITALSNGWYFITITNNILPTGNGQYGIVTNTSDDGSMYIYGAQLNIGSTAKPYLATTDRLNMPRITYPVGGGCGALLLEKQSTNLAYPSEDFTNANWAASNLTITANDATSPDGTQNAEKFVTTSTTFENQVRYGSFSILGNVGSSYTVSVYAKKGTADFLRIRNLFVQDGANSGNAWFNLSTGAVGTIQSSQIASMQNMGNGWYRCVLTGVVGSSNNYNLVDIGFTNTNGTNYPSSSVNGYVYGAQLEASSYATSYIPTTSTSATRIADACYKTGISHLIGQTEGTIFLDIVVKGQSNSGQSVNIYNNNFSADTISTIAILYNNGDITATTFRGNGTYDGIGCVASVYSINQRLKIAYRYKSGLFALSINGSIVATNTTTMTFNGTKTEIYLGSTTVYYGYKDGFELNEFVQFPTALTNAELEALTS